jgi:antitoxin (DNA-binding transcriptional repressor) of toxin-antitoxin stability system
MLEMTVTDAANHFHELFARAAAGETVRIRKRGRSAVRMVRDSEFMTGAEAARCFSGYTATAADVAAADAIAAKIAEQEQEAANALAH